MDGLTFWNVGVTCRRCGWSCEATTGAPEFEASVVSVTKALALHACKGTRAEVVAFLEAEGYTVREGDER